MKPVYQTIWGGADGNCFAACVASIFGVDLFDVPHFPGNDPPGQWFVDWNSWLAQHNVHMDSFELTAGCQPWARSWTIGSVDSPNGSWMHAVVFEGTAMRHDPLPPTESPFKYRLVRDFILFYPIDPAKPFSIPRTGAYEHLHRPQRGEVAA